jgi:cell division protein FtsL
MNFGVFFRLISCILFLVFFLYAYISKQNTITRLRLEIPQIAKKVESVKAENTRLQFEIDQFENPLNLMEIARRPEYRHLKHPLLNEIVTIEIEER